MSYLSLSEIKVGMTLNQVLTSPDGKMVFGQGSLVNEQLMSWLKEWKVEGADVAEEAAIEFSFAEIEKMVSDIVMALAKYQSVEPQAGDVLSCNAGIK